MNKNYVKVDKFSLRYNHYAFIDTDEYLADKLFINHKVRVKFGEEYSKEGSPYLVILCKVKKKDDDKFHNALKEMYNKMILLGHNDYDQVCGMLGFID